ncbi:MAG: hypothetical protein ABIO37_02765 [Caulobacteraceae bacterium]
MRAASIGVLIAAGLSTGAQAATHKHARHAAPSASSTANRELMEKVEALTNQVQALQSRLDTQSQAQQATQAQVAQTQSQIAQTQTQVDKVVSESESVQDRLDNVPTQVLATLSEVPKPKPSWAENTSISGRMYYNVSNISQKANGAKVAPSGTGFDIKRFYVGVDHKFNSIYSANVTTDVQYSSAISSTELFLKKAYLQASYSDALNVRIGAADLPWIPFVEDLYGYRYVEQTITDRTKFGTSSDWGVHAFGKLGPYVSYAVAVIDGAGYKAPLRSKGVDVEGRVSAKYKDFTVAVGGYTGKLGKETQGATNIFHTANRFNFVAAYVHGPVRAGFEYFTASNWSNVTTAVADKSEGYSLFGSYQFTPQFALFGRYDWEKPKKTTAPANKENYFNFGLQYEPTKIVDFSLVYKRDKVDRGTLNTGNGLIGGSIDGTYDEVGMFGQFRW